MANIKTTLRELGVIYGIHIALSGENRDINKKKFIKTLSHYLSSSQKHFLSDLKLNFKENTQVNILTNGMVLGKAIVDTFNLSMPVRLRWKGHLTQNKIPIDLEVNKLRFSLKEQSFILENMGLYKLVNLLTGSGFKRGDLHVFKKFAHKKYEKWFETTWSLFIKFAKSKKSGVIWKHKGKSYQSKIIKKEAGVVFHYKSGDNVKSSKFSLKPNLNIAKYNKGSNSLLREKVFSKWINQTVAKNDDYMASKRDCAITAGKKLEKFVHKNFKKKQLARFLQIYDSEYYYAKVINQKAKIYHVPSLDDFENIYEIDSMQYIVPVSQLNFHTIVRNIKTNAQLELRNEIRFSHGQFNGTPEAKLYYARGNKLDAIYNPLYP